VTVVDSWRRGLKEEERSGAQSVAGPLTPTLGAAFAALALAGEATHLRTVQNNVIQKRAATAQLARAAKNPGIEPQES